MDNAPAYTAGPIIHNRAQVSELEKIGVRSLEDGESFPAGSRVIVRSHGLGRAQTQDLLSRGAVLVDATCPFVERIHRMAEQAGKEGVPLVVVGDPGHAEVRGILGWAGDRAYAVKSEDDVQALPETERAVVVSQTTFSGEKFDELARLLEQRIPHCDVCRTVCTATDKRQAETRALAKECGAMVVIGDAMSSNSAALYRIALRECPRTCFVSSADELDPEFFSGAGTVGITAGASTPDCIIKEVVSRMSEIEKKVDMPEEETQEQAENLTMADVEKTLVQLRPGQTVTGTVVQITDDEVCVNVGYKADGLVKKADLSSTDVKMGDEIEVEVVKVNDGEGNVLLSQKNIVNRKNWEEIVAKYEAGEFVDGVGKEAVKGGLLADVAGVRTFIPASQLSMRYVEKIEEFVGQEMKLKIIEVDKAKKRIVASRKAVLIAEEQEKKKAIWDSLEVGSVVKGVVRRLTDFGAFVDIGGVDGLVHVTDLSWGRVRHPSDVVSVGEEIDVKIQNVDTERERISLSYKATRPRPWTVAADKYPVGSVVEGRVVRITTFGAFVELEPGLDGLVHISQCALTRIAKVEDAVAVGDVVRVKVLGVDTEAKRISLSIREVLEDEAMNADVADEELAMDDVPAEEYPAEDAPAEEVPAEEVPAEGAPAETPAEE